MALVGLMHIIFGSAVLRAYNDRYLYCAESLQQVCIPVGCVPPTC